MCVGQQTRALKRTDNAANIATSRHVAPKMYREPMKPRLPLNLAISARINLNHYWSVLEEFSKCDVMHHVTKSSTSFDDEDLANEINENIVNELREIENHSSRFVDISSTRNEGDIKLELTACSSTTVNPVAIISTQPNFFKKDKPLGCKRKASKSILKLVKKLSKRTN